MSKVFWLQPLSNSNYVGCSAFQSKLFQTSLTNDCAEYLWKWMWALLCVEKLFSPQEPPRVIVEFLLDTPSRVLSCSLLKLFPYADLIFLLASPKHIECLQNSQLCWTEHRQFSILQKLGRRVVSMSSTPLRIWCRKSKLGQVLNMEMNK